ncbi:MAG: DUF4178 domain-containing protein [bacterium]
MVDYDLVEYQVIGKITYNEQGYVWYDYHLFDGKDHLWLYAENDDQVKLGLFKKLIADNPLYGELQKEIPTVINYENNKYSLIEEGNAIIKVEGQIGARDNQQVRYWDFETGNGDQISVEKWGSELEISIGKEVKENLLDFYPARQEEEI